MQGDVHDTWLVQNLDIWDFGFDCWPIEVKVTLVPWLPGSIPPPAARAAPAGSLPLVRSLLLSAAPAGFHSDVSTLQFPCDFLLSKLMFSWMEMHSETGRSFPQRIQGPWGPGSHLTPKTSSLDLALYTSNVGASLSSNLDSSEIRSCTAPCGLSGDFFTLV